MQVAVVGAGGVGGYFGARLADAGNDVGLLARGRHLAAIRANGLRLHSVLGDTAARVRASDDPRELGPSDVLLFCVKSYDTGTVAPLIRPLLADETAVVSLQNGIDNEERIADVVGSRFVVGGAAYIFSAITEPGLVTHTGGPASLVFGEVDGTRSARVERFLAACLDAGISASVPEDIRVVLWTKFAFICAVAGMTAAVRLPIGDIRASAESWAMFRQIVDEVVALARAENVPLPEDVAEQQVRLAAGMPPGSFSSLHHDLVSGHRMELDALHGTVVSRARAWGVSVPVCEAVYAVLRPWALRNG